LLKGFTREQAALERFLVAARSAPGRELSIRRELVVLSARPGCKRGFVLRYTRYPFFSRNRTPWAATVLVDEFEAGASSLNST